MNEELLRLVVTVRGDVCCMQCGLVVPWTTALVTVRPAGMKAGQVAGVPYIVACSVDCLANCVAYVAGRSLKDRDEPEPIAPRPRRSRTLAELIVAGDVEFEPCAGTGTVYRTVNR